MQYKCDKCDKPDAVHLTEITDGNKVEKHLCEDCAVSEGIAMKANVPISQLLEDFVLQSAPSETGQPHEDLQCDVCGLSFAQFRQEHLLGCPHDYDVFEQALQPVLEHAHEGASRHVGKVPGRAPAAQRKQNAILRLRAELRGAVAAEDYEQAASLRDRIKEMEGT